KKFCFILMCLKAFFITCSPPIPSATWIPGSIQYDVPFENSPITIYFDGNKIKASLNHHKNRVDFEIPRARSEQIYYLLITESVVPVAKYTSEETIIENTIDYLKVPSKNPYKLYRLELRTEKIKNTRNNTTIVSYWQVTEITLPENGQI